MTLDLPGVPPEAADLFARLLDEAAEPIASLRAQIDGHVARIHEAAAANEFMDPSLALRIATCCNALLDAIEERDAESARLVQAAVRYFILEDDGESDLESVCGLDDDAAVCNAVARYLQLEDLIVEVD